MQGTRRSPILPGVDSDTRQEPSLDPVAALERLGAVAEASELRKLSDPWEIRKAVDNGRIVRAGPRRYALPVLDEGLFLASRLGGVLSHLSAALYWGWKVKRAPDEPVITIPRGRKRSAEERTGVRVHWGTLPASAIHEGLVTTRARTVVDCCRVLGWDAALSVVDSALREGKVTREQLITEADALPRTGRSRALGLIAAGDARAVNPFESCLRAIAFEVPGLRVQPQFQVDDVGRADLVDPHLRIVIEAESIQFHNDEASFRYDVRRYTAMVRKQWRVVRFCWEDVMFQQDYVRAVRADLVAAGPSGYGQLVPTGSDPRLGGGA